jgi:putative tryptophan/tyrosine transport system ATP-binding protein
MIELKNITVSLNNMPILKNISVTIQPGDFIVIVGPNGSGKSTLLNVMAGSISLSSGSIIIDGEDVTSKSELERMSCIARLFQDPQRNCVAPLTVAQNLALATLKGRRATLNKAIDAYPAEAVETVLRPMMENIDEQLIKPMMSLSGGQRQIISLVMATLKNPKVLLLDEPTAALDPQAATKMLLFSAQFIKKHGITTLLITHDPYVALHLGNKLWIVRNGGIEQFSQDQKRNLCPEQLIGEIDYDQLAAASI